jgi:penicillin-binding protein 2
VAKLALPGVQMAGKTGSSQVRRVSREQREHGHYNSAALPWELRPHALFVAYAPFDAPRYALSVVVEHGNAGAEAAAPIARDIMTDVLTRDPSNRHEAPSQRVAERGT